MSLPPTRADGARTLIGVVHLLPLPGGPSPSPGMDAVLDRARHDAAALAEGGVDGIIVENLGDAPFTRDAVEPFTVAAMTRAITTVQAAAPGVPLGVNVLRNDARSAIGIAAATGAAFVRINVHVGVMVTDQGLIEGDARSSLLDRQRLAPDLGLVVDVHVKHAVPLGGMPLEVAARDAWHRGRADVLVVSGTGTGQPADPDELRRLRDAVPRARLWLGSGVTPANAASYRAADGAIVGTWLHADADLGAPVDADRVRRMRAAW